MVSLTKVYRPREARKRRVEVIWMNKTPAAFLPQSAHMEILRRPARISLATLAQRSGSLRMTIGTLGERRLAAPGFLHERL